MRINLVLLLIGLGAAPALAQSPPASPDKSIYDLFAPVPQADLRGFAPDRPDKNLGPTTIDAGHWQIETDIWGDVQDSGGRAQAMFAADPTLKLGITNSLDAELTLGGYNFQRAKDPAAGLSHSVSGYGDTYVRIKQNIFGNDSGDWALALVPFVKLPTAARGLGNNQIEGGITLPLQFPLPLGMTGLASTEIDFFRNDADGGRHLATANLLSISRPLFSALGASVEIWAQNAAADSPPQASFDTALTYTLGSNIQFDLGAYIGLTRATPNLTSYAGFAQRF